MIKELLSTASEQIQSTLLDITPWWATIIGWVVTLVAAIIPNIISFFLERSFRKDINQLKKAQVFMWTVQNIWKKSRNS